MQAIGEKMGSVCMNCPRHVYEPLEDHLNWMYNYGMKLTSDEEYAWANDNQIEFIPMFIHETMWSPNCSFTVTDPTKWNYCSVEKIVAFLEDTQSKLDVPMKRILGFNEAWDDRSASKYIHPYDMADYWKTVQEVAYEMDLQMVSPTYSNHDEHIEWFAEFLNKCYLMRDDDRPCTVEDIEVLATHEY